MYLVPGFSDLATKYIVQVILPNVLVVNGGISEDRYCIIYFISIREKNLFRIYPRRAYNRASIL